MSTRIIAMDNKIPLAPVDSGNGEKEMKCPVCSSEVKELYNLNTETDDFKCFGCHLTDLDRRVRRLERQENKK
jgi:hypothetical protein